MPTYGPPGPRTLCYSDRVRTPLRALLFALLTALACTPAPPVVADTPRPTAPPPTPSPPPPPTTITVHAAAPGRDPLAVEHDITVPLEQALAGVPGLARLRSESRSDLATLVLTLAPGTASDLARAAVVEQLTAARATLPADILPPTLAPELGPHPVHFLLTGDTVPASELRDLAGRLRSDLSSTPGVATIDLCGGRDAQLQIVLDPARLAALAVPLTAILTSLRTSLQGDTLLAPGLQARVSARSLDDLTHLVVKPGPPAITLADLARISVGADIPDCDAIQLTGAAIVLATVHPRRDADPGAFNSAVQARLPALRATLPAGLELRVASLDRVALELLAGPPGETLPRAAQALTGALAGARRGHLQARTRVAPGAPLALELLLEPASTADPDALAAALATVPDLRVRAINGDLAALTRVVVLGDDLEISARLADELAALARTLPGIRHADVRWALDPELALDLQRERLAQLGVPEADLRAVLSAALAGVDLGTLDHAGQTLPVKLHLGEPGTADPAARVRELAALQLPTASGSVPLAELVSFRRATQPHAIVRRDRRRAVEVELQLTDPAARDALQTKLAADLRLPPGYVVQFD